MVVLDASRARSGFKPASCLLVRRLTATPRSESVEIPAIAESWHISRVYYHQALEHFVRNTMGHNASVTIRVIANVLESTMSDKCYHYHALSTASREIRLLTLLPDGESEPLRCQLTTVSLASGANYNALSYVWGNSASSTPESTILLGSNRFSVTPNLHSALRHLRGLGSESLCLWVDAVCINQKETDERNQQVAMMRDIYASAAQVTIWLGESDEHSDFAFDAMRAVADKRSWFWRGNPEEEAEQRSDVLKHCGDFFFSLESSRPWFSRVWILQELAVAKGDPVVVCGYKSILWSSFATAWQAISKSPSFGLVSLQKEHQVPGGKSQFLAQTKLDVLDNLRKSTQETGGSLRRLLLISCTSAATDPRDRIYGLHGLLEKDTVDPNHSVTIKVDYRKSCAEVYADAMAHIFSRGDGPHFLSGIFLSGGPVPAPHILSLPASVEQPGLPSWAPDFSRQTFDTARQPTCMSFLPPSTMSASGAGQGAKNGRVLEDGRTLQVEGLLVDTVDDVIPFGSTLKAVVESLAHLQSMTDQARKRPCLFDSLIVSHMQIFRESEPLWRTLISNKHVKSGYEPAPASYGKTYLSYLSAASIDEKLSEHTDDALKPEFELALRSCIGRKSFFTTRSGFVGTCMPSTLKSDTIAIVFGSPSPFVLRPIPSTEANELAYSLIGTCYLGGIMNGEMVDELYCEDLMDSTTFLIR